MKLISILLKATKVIRMLNFSIQVILDYEIRVIKIIDQMFYRKYLNDAQK